MPTTAKGLRYPSASAAPNIPQDIQNLASDVNYWIPEQWVKDVTNSTYDTTPNTSAWTDLPVLTATVTVPAGRTLEVDFMAPLVTANTSGEADLRLMIGASVEDTAQVISGAFGAFAVSVRLQGAVVGTGAAVTFKVQGFGVAGGGRIQAGRGVVTLRHRII